MGPEVRDPARLRVLFLNTRAGIGADVAVHLTLARHLGAAGVEAAVATNRAAPDLAALQAELAGAPGVAVLPYHLGRQLYGRRGLARAGAALGNAAALASFAHLAASIQWRRIDVLHTTDRPRDALFATLRGRATGRPVVVHMHSNWGPGMSRATRWAFAQCACVLGVSEYTRRSLEAAGLPPERLAAVHNAVDAAHFNPDPMPRGLARARWGIPPGVPLVGLVGRLIPFKGHDDLLQALALGRGPLAAAHVLIVGAETDETRAYASALRSRAAALGLAGRVHFTGLQTDVRPIYADLDALAVPSWEEPFGLVVVEAMAMRVPVAAYRAGGIPEIVRDGVDGLLAAPRATGELAAALERLLGDAVLRRRLGAAGRERASTQFTPEGQARDVAALYRHLVKRERIPARVSPVHG